jgi:hypothetical protein
MRAAACDAPVDESLRFERCVPIRFAASDPFYEWRAAIGGRRDRRVAERPAIGGRSSNPIRNSHTADGATDQSARFRPGHGDPRGGRLDDRGRPGWPRPRPAWHRLRLDRNGERSAGLGAGSGGHARGRRPRALRRRSCRPSHHQRARRSTVSQEPSRVHDAVAAHLGDHRGQVTNRPATVWPTVRPTALTDCPGRLPLASAQAHARVAGSRIYCPPEWYGTNSVSQGLIHPQPVRGSGAQTRSVGANLPVPFCGRGSAETRRGGRGSAETRRGGRGSAETRRGGRGSAETRRGGRRRRQRIGESQLLARGRTPSPSNLLPFLGGSPGTPGRG